MRVAGTEEAGRGPVVGNMVIALVAAEEERINELETKGVTDSKELKPERREELYDFIQETCDVHTVHVTPDEIDNALTNPDSNLNVITADAMTTLIHACNADKIWIDSPTVNTDRFKSMVDTEGNDATLTVENKADQNYTIVGAASIIAKVERDRGIRQLEDELDVTIGSGYPSDPQTQAFLDEHYDDYDCFRTSWTTWQARKHEQDQQGLDQYSKN